MLLGEVSVLPVFPDGSDVAGTRVTPGESLGEVVGLSIVKGNTSNATSPLKCEITS